MVYGYIRVSTDKQDYDNQKHGILEYCNRLKISPIEFVTETISSRVKLEERDINRLLGDLKDGDILVTSELSRLGRSILEVMTIFKSLTERGVTTHIIKGGFVINGTDNKIQSSVLIFAFGLSAEIERELISQRTKEALQRRKSEGVVLGRKKGAVIKSKLDGKEEQIIDLVSKGVPVASIAKIFGCARGTLVNFIASRKIKTKD